MPSNLATLNEEVIQAHREALQSLRTLLAESPEPTERRRIAVAILRIRPMKDPAPPSPDPSRRRCAEAPRVTDEGASSPSPRWGAAGRRCPPALRRADEGAPPLARAAGEGGGGSATPGEGASTNLSHYPTPSSHPDDLGHDDDLDNLDDDALNDDFEDNDDLEDDDLSNPDDPAMQEINNLTRQLERGQNPLAALQRLQEIMEGNFEAYMTATSAPTADAS